MYNKEYKMSLKLKIIWNRIKGLIDDPLKPTEEKKTNDAVDIAILAIDEIADSYIEIIKGIKRTLKDHIPTIKKIVKDNKKEFEAITTTIRTLGTNLETIVKTSSSDIETITNDLARNTENGKDNIISILDTLIDATNDTPKHNKTVEDEIAEINERVELLRKRTVNSTK